jgi:hypothetical protein
VDNATRQFCKIAVSGQGPEAIESMVSILRKMASDGWQADFADFANDHHWIVFRREA